MIIFHKLAVFRSRNSKKAATVRNFHIQPKKKWSCSVTQGRAGNLLMQSPPPSWHSFPLHSLLYFSSLSAVSDEESLLRHDHTIRDSFEATWPLSLTLKAQHLLVLDVKLNPLMISSLQRSHGKFLLDYIVGKSFELDIELKQTFFCLLKPKVWAVCYCFISFMKQGGGVFQKWISDSDHWLWSSTNETPTGISAVVSLNLYIQKREKQEGYKAALVSVLEHQWIKWHVLQHSEF